MIELNYSSAKGREIFNRASRCVVFTLEQAYDKPSLVKINAYNHCYNEYLKTKNSTGFGICSFNSFQFTCSWIGELNGENIVRYETANNSYLIWVNR